MQYVLSYDLHKPHRSYDSLYRLLAGWGAVRLSTSLWAANLKGPAEVVRDLMLAHLDNDDSVAVVEIKPGSDWATMRVPPAACAWLSANVTPAKAA
jgi:hypothetical protein